MLHEVPNSTLRGRMLEVLKLQCQLLNALCALPIKATVDEAWLARTWPDISDTAWLEHFWNNDKGTRSIWCTTIAAATVAEKQTILDMMAEQLRFQELYADPPTVRLTVYDWKATAVMSAVQDLLESFYAPLFYKACGYPSTDGTRFHKDHFVEAMLPRPMVCPYNDTHFQFPKLDHFLPKSKFPMLSCHPDNLIPASTDANSIEGKGSKIPLGLADQAQAANWFHPRLRSAKDTFTVTFDHTSQAGPQARLAAKAPENEIRLTNLNGLFRLSEFWSHHLDDELQFIAGEIRDGLQEAGIEPTDANPL
jgi:hypothetical protein